jgi:hypothetical protein
MRTMTTVTKRRSQIIPGIQQLSLKAATLLTLKTLNQSAHTIAIPGSSPRTSSNTTTAVEVEAKGICPLVVLVMRRPFIIRALTAVKKASQSF